MQHAVFETEVNEKAETPYRYAVGRLKPNQMGLPNWHQRLEVLVGLYGECDVWLNGRRYVLKKGDTVIANSEVIHNVSSLGGEAAFGILHINGSFFKENGMDISRLNFKEYISGDQTLEKLTESIADLYGNNNDKLNKARIRKVLLELVIYIYDNHREQEPKGTVTAAFDRVREAMRYIRANMTLPLTLDGIAATANINKYQLAKEFKNVAGVTVFEFINTVRCQEAKRLITDGAFVSEAAFSCGYKNLSYFTRTYKKLTGELPKETKK